MPKHSTHESPIGELSEICIIAKAVEQVIDTTRLEVRVRHSRPLGINVVLPSEAVLAAIDSDGLISYYHWNSDEGVPIERWHLSDPNSIERLVQRTNEFLRKYQ